MPLPGNLTTVRVTGAYLDFEGAPIGGWVEFVPPVALVDLAADVVLLPRRIRVQLHEGAFAVDLLVTDDPEAAPDGWTYTIREVWAGGRLWSFTLPAGLGQTVDVTDLIATAPSYGTPPSGDHPNLASHSALGLATQAELEDVAGAPGPAGPPGADGDDGAPGPAGPPGADGDDALPAVLDIRDFGATTASADNAAAIQAAIDAANAAYAASGSLTQVFVPGGVWLCSGVAMRSGVTLFGEGHGSMLKLTNGEADDLIGSKLPGTSTYTTPYKVTLRDLRLYGNKANGATGRLVALYNGASDAQETEAYPNVHMHHVLAHGSGSAAAAVYWGQNLRESWMHEVMIYDCVGAGLEVRATDAQITNVQVGLCGDGVSITGQANLFGNCKSWYNGQASGNAGRGNGFTMERFGGDGPLTGNQLVGCQTQDNAGYGFAFLDRDDSRLSACVSGADALGCAYLDVSHGNVIDLHHVWGDLAPYTTNAGIVVNGACTRNHFVYSDAPTWRTPATWAPVKFTGGATAADNSFQWRHAATALRASVTNTLAPDCSQGGYFKLALTANGNLNDATNALPGQEITIEVLQDATGGRTLTYTSMWQNAPPVNKAPSSATLMTFKNRSATAVPVWAYIGGTANMVDTQAFATAGAYTWTKPAGAYTTYHAFVISGGSGGGSGRKGLAATIRCGGGGGASGGFTEIVGALSSLGATEPVVVGAGGAGGAAQATNSTDGNAGTRGGESSFGATLLRTAAGGGGSGGSATSGGGGTATGSASIRTVATGASASTTGGIGAAGTDATGGGGGGSGGGIAVGGATTSGGRGGAPSVTNLATAGPGGNPGGNGNPGNNINGARHLGGGGSGGGSSVTANGGTGGVGGVGGGGGGGGAAVDATGNSGAGGAGGVGLVVVVCW